MLKWASQTTGPTEMPYLCLTSVPCECVSGSDMSYCFMIQFYIVLCMLWLCCDASALLGAMVIKA